MIGTKPTAEAADTRVPQGASGMVEERSIGDEVALQRAMDRMEVIMRT